jgi:hypothetical protein
VKFSSPDAERAESYAERVISILVDNGLADQSATTDEGLKEVLAMWLQYLSEALSQEFEDPRCFIETALLHQRTLIGLAEDNRKKASLKESSENLHKNASAISLWNPILLPIAALYLTCKDEVPGEVYAAYWPVIAERRADELFPRLPLEMLTSQATNQNEEDLSVFAENMKQLTISLLEEHFEILFSLGLESRQPEKITDQLFKTWETTWQSLAKRSTQEEMQNETMRLYFLLKTLGYFLACEMDFDSAKQVALLIDERTKHGWHGFYPTIVT